MLPLLGSIQPYNLLLFYHSFSQGLHLFGQMVQISLPFLQNHLDMSIFILNVLLWLLPIGLVVQTLVLAFAFATLLLALTLLILFLQ